MLYTAPHNSIQFNFVCTTLICKLLLGVLQIMTPEQISLTKIIILNRNQRKMASGIKLTRLIHLCSSPAQIASFKDKSEKTTEMDSVSARKKVCCVRQENACLTTQDEQLIRDLNALQYELAAPKPQV